MAKIENKFLVLKLSDIDKLDEPRRLEVQVIIQAINKIRLNEERGPIPKYWVCNQNEPYAQRVIDYILIGEDRKEFLNRVGDHAFCKGCGREIWWLEHKQSGKSAPYTFDLLNHFIDCPKAQEFKRSH